MRFCYYCTIINVADDSIVVAVVVAADASDEYIQEDYYSACAPSERDAVYQKDRQRNVQLCEN
jgi:hypothetical protein